MNIFLRIRQGWSPAVKNKSKEVCDLDGAKLWINPGGQIYCDLEHDTEVVARVLEVQSER